MEEIVVCKTEHEWAKKMMQVEHPVVVPQTQTLIKYQGSLYEQLSQTAAVSRLGRIKQLGLAFYTVNLSDTNFYHLVSHTRYGHSLTFATKMDQLAQTLGLDRKIAVATGLLHDIASPPFSDSMAYAVNMGDEAQFDHILQKSTDLLNVLEKNKISKGNLSNLVRGYDRSPLGQLANSSDSIDVDRWSYVRDDAWYTAIAPNSWRGKNLPDPFKHVSMCDGKVVFEDIDSVREFLEARVQMYEKVYKNDALAAKEAFVGQIVNKIRKHANLSIDNLLAMDDSHFESLAHEYGGQLGKDVFSIFGNFQSYGMLKAGEQEAYDFIRKKLDGRPFAIRKTKALNPATGTLILMDRKVEPYRELEPEHAEELKTRMSTWNYTTVYGYINDAKVESAFDEASRRFGEEDPVSGDVKFNEMMRETTRKAEWEFLTNHETL